MGYKAYNPFASSDGSSSGGSGGGSGDGASVTWPLLSPITGTATSAAYGFQNSGGGLFGNSSTIGLTNGAGDGLQIGSTGLASFSKALSVGTTLSVSGSSALAALSATSVSASGNMSATGTLSVGGASTFQAVSATQITASGTLGVSGSATLAALSATNVSASGTLNVSGSTTLAALSAGNTSLSGTLGVSGAASLASLSVSGSSTLAALSASNGSFSGTLSVSGNTTLGALTASSISTGTLAASGMSTLAGVSASSVSVSGNLSATGTTTLNTLTANGASTLAALSASSGSISGTLSVSGATTLAGLSAQATQASSLTVSGSSSLASVSASSLSSSGNLSVSGSTSVAALTATGSTTLAALSASSASVSGGVQTGTLTVSGTSSLQGLTTTSATLGGTTQAATLNVSGTLTAGSLASSGPLGVPQGSVSAPGLYIQGQSGSGLYGFSDGRVALAVLGVNTLTAQTDNSVLFAQAPKAPGASLTGALAGTTATFSGTLAAGDSTLGAVTGQGISGVSVGVRSGSPGSITPVHTGGDGTQYVAWGDNQGNLSLAAKLSVGGAATFGSTLFASGDISGANVNASVAVNAPNVVAANLVSGKSLSTNGSAILAGSGSPEGQVVGNVGDTYTDTGGGGLYLKATGTGNTGWLRLAKASELLTFPLMGTRGTSPAFTFTGPAGDGVASSGPGLLQLQTGGTTALSIDGAQNATLSAQLSVSGPATLASLTAASATVSGALDVSGATTLAALTAGATTLGALTGSGATFSGALTSNGLTVHGTASVDNDVVASGVVKATKLVAGTATILTGSGAPEGSVVGTAGDLYLDTEDGSSATFYFKRTGQATPTGWMGAADASAVLSPPLALANGTAAQPTYGFAQGGLGLLAQANGVLAFATGGNVVATLDGTKLAVSALTASGQLTAGSVSAGDIRAGTIETTGAVSVAGNLSAAGLTLNNNATVGGTLTVTGAASLGAGSVAVSDFSAKTLKAGDALWSSGQSDPPAGTGNQGDIYSATGSGASFPYFIKTSAGWVGLPSPASGGSGGSVTYPLTAPANTSAPQYSFVGFGQSGLSCNSDGSVVLAASSNGNTGQLQVNTDNSITTSGVTCDFVTMGYTILGGCTIGTVSQDPNNNFFANKGDINIWPSNGQIFVKTTDNSQSDGWKTCAYVEDLPANSGGGSGGSSGGVPTFPLQAPQGTSTAQYAFGSENTGLASFASGFFSLLSSGTQILRYDATAGALQLFSSTGLCFDSFQKVSFGSPDQPGFFSTSAGSGICFGKDQGTIYGNLGATSSFQAASFSGNISQSGGTASLQALTATSVQAGAASFTGLTVNGSAQSNGSGNPNGNVSGSIGDTYTDKQAGVFYVKQGSGTSGWSQVAFSNANIFPLISNTNSGVNAIQIGFNFGVDGIYSQNSGTFGIATNNTTALSIDSSQNVTLAQSLKAAAAQITNGLSAASVNVSGSVSAGSASVSGAIAAGSISASSALQTGSVKILAGSGTPSSSSATTGAGFLYLDASNSATSAAWFCRAGAYQQIALKSDPANISFPIVAPSSSSSAPAFATTDGKSGLYSSAAGALALCTNNTDAITVDSSQHVTLPVSLTTPLADIAYLRVPKVVYAEQGSAPASVSGYGQVFVRSSDKNLCFVNSAGTLAQLSNAPVVYPLSVPNGTVAAPSVGFGQGIGASSGFYAGTDSTNSTPFVGVSVGGVATGYFENQTVSSKPVAALYIGDPTTAGAAGAIRAGAIATPNGAVSGYVGQAFLSTAGGPGAVLFVKESYSSSTPSQGWAAAYTTGSPNIIAGSNGTAAAPAFAFPGGTSGYALVSGVHTFSSAGSTVMGVGAGGATINNVGLFVPAGSLSAPSIASSSAATTGLRWTTNSSNPSVGIVLGGSNALNVIKAPSAVGGYGLSIGGDAFDGGGIITGTATNPNSSVTASPGTIYICTAGGANATFFGKETGSNNTTGFVKFATTSTPLQAFTVTPSAAPNASPGIGAVDGNSIALYVNGAAVVSAAPSAATINGTCTVNGATSGTTATYSGNVTSSATVQGANVVSGSGFKTLGPTWTYSGSSAAGAYTNLGADNFGNFNYQIPFAGSVVGLSVTLYTNTSTQMRFYITGPWGDFFITIASPSANTNVTSATSAAKGTYPFSANSTMVAKVYTAAAASQIYVVIVPLFELGA